MSDHPSLKPVIWIRSSRRDFRELAGGVKSHMGYALYVAQQGSKHMKKKIDYEVGSGNVFADIGLPNAEEHLVKAQLVYKISGLLKARGLKQVDAAKLFGVKQPDISKMLRGDFRQFSVERLLRFLVALGQDVEIVVKPHRGARKAAQLRVTDAAAGSAA
jgi:predicted XRE-type DNA-binding protein